MLALLQPNAEKSAATVASLEAKLSAAKADVDKARGDISRLTVAVEEGDADALPQLKQARKTLETAQKLIPEITSALDVARGRLDDAEAVERGKQNASRWQEVERLARERVEVAKEIEHQAAKLAASYDKLVQLSGDMLEAAPVKIGVSWNPLSKAAVSDSFRFALLRSTGWRWVFKEWPYPPESAPEFLPKIAESHEWILSKRGALCHDNL